MWCHTFGNILGNVIIILYWQRNVIDHSMAGPNVHVHTPSQLCRSSARAKKTFKDGTVLSVIVLVDIVSGESLAIVTKW